MIYKKAVWSTAMERKLIKTTKSFPYRFFKLTMQFRILFNRQSMPFFAEHFTKNNQSI